MAPLKKRHRLDEIQQTTQRVHHLSGATTTLPTLDRIQDVFSDLQHCIHSCQLQLPPHISTQKTTTVVDTNTKDTNENRTVHNNKDHDDNDNDIIPNTIRTSFWRLLEWQHELYTTLSIQEDQLKQLRAYQYQNQRQILAQSYERAHLQQQIVLHQQYATPYLEQLAHQEVNIQQEDKDVITNTNHWNKTTTASTITTSTTNPQEQIVQQFLQHVPWLQKDVVLLQLQQCGTQRKRLQATLEQKQLELHKTKQKLHSQQLFLEALPRHLKTIQKASHGLHKFLTASTTVPILHHMGGSATRIQRLLQAQTLPPTLYTVFCQLQYYVDEIRSTQEIILQQQNQSDNTNDNMEDIANDTVNTVSIATSNKIRLLVSPASSINGSITTATTATTITTNNQGEVVLQMPVADPKGNKRVSLHFISVGDRIAVYATGCASTLNQDLLLQELFPGDVETPIVTSTTTSATTTTMMSAVDPNTSIVGSGDTNAKSYQWCNLLGGLYHPTSMPTIVTSSLSSSQSVLLRPTTRVVLQELQKRIRANATLKYILHSLQRCIVPVPPPPPPSFCDTDPLTQEMDNTTKPTTTSNDSSEPLCSFTFLLNESSNNNNNINIDNNTTEQHRSDNNTCVFHVTVGDAVSSQPKQQSHKSSKGCSTTATAATTTTTLNAVVTIHTIRYPAVPPVWKLVGRGSSFNPTNNNNNNNNDSNTLYDPYLMELEHHLNQTMLQCVAMEKKKVRTISSSSSSSSSLHFQIDDTQQQLYCEWILVHQLRYLLQHYGKGSKHESKDDKNI